LTAIFVAKDCGIVDKNHTVILGTLKPSEDEKKIREIEWKIIEGSLDEDSFGDFSRSSLPDNQVGIEMPPEVTFSISVFSKYSRKMILFIPNLSLSLSLHQQLRKTL